MNMPYISGLPNDWQRKDSNDFWQKFILLICVGLFIVLIISCLATFARGETASPEGLWKGLIAEATSEGYDGMYAIACVVRNRLNSGMDTGLVALKRRDLDGFVKREGRKVEHTAKNIVRKVFEGNGIDTTRGATHYENVQRFGIPHWARSMVKTVKIGNHTFFKEKVQ